MPAKSTTKKSTVKKTTPKSSTALPKKPALKTAPKKSTPKKERVLTPEIVDKMKKDIDRKAKNGTLLMGQEYIQPGDNSKFLHHEIEVFNAPPIDLKDYDQVSERINWYFELCAKNDMKPTVNGFALALGTTREYLYGITTGRLLKQHTEVCAIIKKTYAVLKGLWEDYMANGKINPATGIFLGKNHFAYQDEVKVVAEQSSEKPSDDALLKNAELLPENQALELTEAKVEEVIKK